MVPFATGLLNPVGITNAGDERLFVVEQEGLIRIVNPDGTINPEPFLDIQDKVIFQGERGLLGLAFHPAYKANGYFYVNYVGKGNRTHIARFKVNADVPDKADPESELTLMEILQPFDNHKGGNLAFGPDSMLYIGLGDGGSAGDPQNNARNPLELLGKILRIDVNRGDTYAIPESNPFHDVDNARGEIWALGLRNPWRFSFDRLTGDLWIADVGQDKFEEINFQPADSKGGENYGWRCYEGNEAFNRAGCESDTTFTFPIYTYAHGAECSIIGGFVYRGSTSSEWYGHYFFTDYCSNKIWTLHKEGDNWVKEDFGDYPGNNFTTFGEDQNGQLYLAEAKTKTLYKVVANTTAIDTDPLAEEIKVIQLPNSNKIRITSMKNLKGDKRILLSDMKGTLLFMANTREDNYEFDTGALPAGIYIVNIGVEDKKFVHKLIKANP
jgi:glucose/arabinose dehydrogenase